MQHEKENITQNNSVESRAIGDSKDPKILKGDRMKKILSVFFVLVLAGGIYVYFNRRKINNNTNEQNIKTFEQVGKIGVLEIEILKAEEGSYSTFEVIDGQAQRIEKQYYKVYTKVFNPSSADKAVFKSIKLVDDLNNEYEPDISILFDLRTSPGPFKEFGRDMNIYPRTIREGDIVFPEISQDAKILQLVFENETGEKAAFEFEK